MNRDIAAIGIAFAAIIGSSSMSTGMERIRRMGHLVDLITAKSISLLGGANNAEQSRANRGRGLRLLARGLGLIAFVFWGTFFVEHLSEWFGRTADGPVPFKVGLSMALHGLMLVSFVMMLKWEVAGGIAAAVFTLAFFLSIQVYAAMVITLIPAVCAILAGMSSSKVSKKSHP